MQSRWMTILFLVSRLSFSVLVEEQCAKVPDTCPFGWAYFAATKSCYITGTKMDWMSAQEWCEQKGANLASIHSQVENYFVNDLCSNGLASYYDNCWIGLRRDIEDTSKFINIDGSPYDYSNWNSGEPSDPDTEWCVSTYSSQRADHNQLEEYLHWNDINCETVLKKFVCKKPDN